MSSSSSRQTKKKTEKGDEVEELLRAAEDEMVLKLSVDSHMSRVSPSYIDPHLDHRFQALKSRPKPPPPLKPNPNPNPPPTISTTDYDNPQVDDRDLFARFAALKGSLPSSSSSSSSSSSNNQQPKGRVNDDNIDDEDEVEKLINWAVDAARLDPSPPSDSDTDDYSDDDHSVDVETKGQRN